MIAFVVNRLIHTIPVLLGVSVIAFLILRLAPGDPLQLMLPAYATQRDVEELRRSLGLDQSLVVQYFAWLGQVVQGNLGRSLFTSGSVLGEILERFPNTLILAVAAIGLAVVFGMPLGILAAAKRGTALDSGSIDRKSTRLNSSHT